MTRSLSQGNVMPWDRLWDEQQLWSETTGRSPIWTANSLLLLWSSAAAVVYIYSLLGRKHWKHAAIWMSCRNHDGAAEPEWLIQISLPKPDLYTVATKQRTSRAICLETTAEHVRWFSTLHPGGMSERKFVLPKGILKRLIFKKRQQIKLVSPHGIKTPTTFSSCLTAEHIRGLWSYFYIPCILKVQNVHPACWKHNLWSQMQNSDVHRKQAQDHVFSVFTSFLWV